MTLRGADHPAVRSAVADRDPFPGTFGFAGSVDDRLVRDVLGRVPLYVERTACAETPLGTGVRIEPAVAGAPDRWAFAPADLDDPVAFPAGHRSGPDGLERCWRFPNPDPEPDPSAAIDRVRDAVGTAQRAAALRPARGAGEAAERRVADGAEPVAVAFSGGVDSALVATCVDGPLYVAGFPDSHDLEAARSAAAAMGRSDDLHVVELDLDRLERAVPTVARAIGRTNAMDVSIALPLYLVAERAAADGYGRLAIGQGADECFGGYEKVARLDHRVEADTVRGAVREQLETLPDQLPRDVLAICEAGVEPVAPFLHDRVVEAALRLPDELLVSGETRKRALRMVARERLPESVADRDKKAVQYGSLVSRELDRLARRAGYKRRMDDHVRKYVESRLA